MATNRMQTACMICWKYVGDNLPRHLQTCKEYNEDTDKEVSNRLKGMYKSAAYNISGNILVNPTHYIEKEVYSKREVLEILQRYGHSIMPLKYCKGGMEKPKPLLLTGRDTIADHVSGHEPVPALPVHPVNAEKVHSIPVPAVPALPVLPDNSENVHSVHSEPVPAWHTLSDNSETEDSDADTELMNVSTESLCRVRKSVHRIYSSDEETEGEAGLPDADIGGKQRVSRVGGPLHARDRQRPLILLPIR